MNKGEAMNRERLENKRQQLNSESSMREITNGEMVAIIDAMLDSPPSEPQPAKRSAVEEMEAEIRAEIDDCKKRRDKFEHTDSRLSYAHQCRAAATDDALWIFQQHLPAILKEAVDQFAERVVCGANELRAASPNSQYLQGVDEVIAILDKAKGK